MRHAAVGWRQEEGGCGNCSRAVPGHGCLLHAGAGALLCTRTSFKVVWRCMHEAHTPLLMLPSTQLCVAADPLLTKLLPCFQRQGKAAFDLLFKSNEAAGSTVNQQCTQRKSGDRHPPPPPHASHCRSIYGTNTQRRASPPKGSAITPCTAVGLYAQAT